MPIIYSYSSSGRAREGTGSQGSGSREGRGGLPSRSASSRSTYIGGNRNGGASRTGLGINRRNSSSAIEGGSGIGAGVESGEDPEPTDADDSIFLSDLVRTGEASRLRRRGAMRLDHYHREGTQTTLLNENPSTRTGPTGSISRGNTLRNTESILSVLRTNASISRTGSAQLDASSGRFEGDLWVPPAALRRSSANIVTPRSNADSLNNDSESYTYTLFCGYEPEPGTEEYAAYEERWAEEDFVRKQMCSEAFTPSPFPVHPSTSSISSKGKAKATPSPPPRSNGCGALLHLHAAPRSELGVWTANTEATEAVVPLDPEYFVDSSSDASGRSRGGSSRTLESRLGSAMVKVNIVKSACGCVREGVGCAACGNPLGTLYKPCRTAAESIFSNTRSSRSRRPGSVNAETLTSGVHQSSWSTGRPDGPQGPAYWRSTSSVSQLHSDSPSSSSPSVQTSSSSTPKSPDHPYCIYTFFSNAVSSSPQFSFSSSRNNTSSRPSASRYTSNVSNASSDSNSSSVTTRPTIFMHRVNRSPTTPSSPSPLTATSPYVLVPPSTSDAPSIIPTPSSGVTASGLNIATVPVSMPPEANRVIAVEASGDRGDDRDNYGEGREIRNRPSIVSLASTVTVVSENDAEDRTGNNTREGDGEFEEDRAALRVGDGQPLDSLPLALSVVNLGDNPSSPSPVVPETVSDRPVSPLTPTRLFPNFLSRDPATESQHVPSAEEFRRRGGRPIPQRRARIGEDEAEAALRRVYGDRDSNEILLHMLTGNFTLVEEEEDEINPQPSATSRTELDMQEPSERAAVENVGTGVDGTVDGTPRAAAAAANFIPLEQESRSMNLNAPSANSVTSLESTTTSGPQVDSNGLSDFTVPVSLTAPIPTTPSLHHMLEPHVMHTVSENIESVELRAGAATRQESQAQAVDNNAAQVTDPDMDTVHTEHVLALIRRAREQAQERREVMLDLLMGTTPYIRSGTGGGVDNNNTNNHNTRSLSVPSSPSSTASSLPPLVFPPTPTSPSLPASPTSPIRSPEAISRLTDLIRNVRVVAETTGMERQPEWAFEEWMSSLEENRTHGETDRTGEAVSHRRSEDISREDLDSDTESELEGRIMFRQTRRSDWRPREGGGGNGLRLGMRQRQLEADDDEVEEDSWSLPSMPALQDVSDSEDDGIPGVWEDSSDDDERSDIAGVDREESSRANNRAFDSNGELLGTLEEDVDKPSEAGRARMGARVPSNIVAGR